MAEIVNLRLVRKARQRQDAEQLAAEQRARFGRTRAERSRDAEQRDRLDRAVDGARREPGGPPSAKVD